jgi:hypothetical protein
LPAAEREHVLAHTGVCRQCDTHRQSIETQRALLRNLAQAEVPEGLAARLRVMASHERERQLARVSFATRMRRWTANVELVFDNLMKPVALPFTGGLVSTLLIFALLVPRLSFSHPTSSNEFTTAEFATAGPRGSIVTTPWNEGVDEAAVDFPVFTSPDQPDSDYVNIVNLTIDESGKVVDWSVVRGHLTDEINSIILFSRFQPATALGVKTSGIIQVRQSLPPCKYMHCTNNNSVTVRG